MVINFCWNNKVIPFVWPPGRRLLSLQGILPLLKLPVDVVDTIVGVKTNQQLFELTKVIKPTDNQLELISFHQAIGQQMVQTAGCYLVLQLLFERILNTTSAARVVDVKITTNNFIIDVLVQPPLKITVKEKLEQLFAEQKATIGTGSYLVRKNFPGFSALLPAASVAKINFLRLLSVSGVNYAEYSGPVSRLRATSLASTQQIKSFHTEMALTEHYDHRVLGKQMELFLYSPATGQGLVLWRPRGVVILNAIRDYVAEHNRKWDYQTVITPVLAPQKMYERSGHLAHYRSDMFGEIKTHSESLFLRPMTCPHHIMMYKLTGVHSYRELPIKLAEFAQLFRYEASGALAGIERTRAMMLPDAHLFLRVDQLEAEIKKCFLEITQALADFQLPIIRIVLACHDPAQADKYYPDPKMWRRAEAMLARVLADLKVSVHHSPGEAAFYGPKIDFQILNLAQHEITLASLQLDFMLPDRFQLRFVGADKTTNVPIMVHRGLIGSVERLVAVLLEQTRGWLPLWLAPVQVLVLPISIERHLAFSRRLARRLQKEQIRYQLEHSSRRVGATIRQAQKLRIPYLILIGDKEIATDQISVRSLPTDTSNTMTVTTFIEKLRVRLKKKL